MARKLVPGFRYASNDFGITLRDPTQREKRRLHIGIAEQRQDAVDVLLDPARHRFPFAAPYVGSERRDLEIVLHVDRERIDDRTRGTRLGSHARLTTSRASCRATH